MPRIVRSARGELVDFDLIAIANQLASAPIPVSIHERRQFIDDKDGVKPPKKVAPAPVHDALQFATNAASAQRKVVPEEPKVKEALKVLPEEDDDLKRKTS